ncbi:hypothetical protein [Pseudomonas sp. 25 E 4]|nr:hypothetical protein [Pseudomonas sp. 25 E 4]
MGIALSSAMRVNSSMAARLRNPQPMSPLAGVPVCGAAAHRASARWLWQSRPGCKVEHWPSRPWAALSVLQQNCHEHGPSVLTVQLRLVRPVRCNHGHDLATIALEKAPWRLLLPAGRVVKRDYQPIGWAAGLPPYPGLSAHLAVRLFQYLHPRFIAMDQATGQQTIAHQIQQRRELIAALDHAPNQSLTRDIDAVATQNFFKSMKR